MSSVTSASLAALRLRHSCKNTILKKQKQTRGNTSSSIGAPRPAERNQRPAEEAVAWPYPRLIDRTAGGSDQITPPITLPHVITRREQITLLRLSRTHSFSFFTANIPATFVSRNSSAGGNSTGNLRVSPSPSAQRIKKKIKKHKAKFVLNKFTAAD